MYTGVTTDVTRRWSEHSQHAGTGKKGAKFFRGRKPKSLVFLAKCVDRSSACKNEASIKKLVRREKLLLIESSKNLLAQFPEFSKLEAEE